MDAKREREIIEFFEKIRPIITPWSQLIKSNPTVLDAGCGEGLLAIKIAEMIKADRLILIDRTNILAVSIPANAEFHQLDICSSEFLEQFRGRVNMLISNMLFHELAYPLIGVSHLFSVLPVGGLGLLFDRSEEGWRYQRQVAGVASTVEHYERDIKNAREIGVDTNKGIREFWEQKVFPKLPGQANLFFYKELYLVAYLSLPWGRVKPMPTWVREALVRSGFIK